MSVPNDKSNQSSLKKHSKLNDRKNFIYDHIKLLLLNFVSFNIEKEKIINTFHSEKLKLKAMKALGSQESIIEIAKTLADPTFIKQALNMIENDWDKSPIIKRLPSEMERFNFARTLKRDGARFEVIKTLTSDALKAKSVSFFADAYTKVTIINSIQDENIRYQLLNQLKDESDKVSVISTFQDELKLKSLDLLTDDYYKIKVILTFHSDQLKLEGIKKLQEDWSKEEVIETLTDLACIKQALNMIENDWKKASIIKQLPDEIDRFNFARMLKSDDDARFEVITTLTSDSLKAKAVSFFAYDDKKASIIKRLSNEIDRFNFARMLKSDVARFEVIKTLTSDALKAKAVSFFADAYTKATIINSIQDENIRYQLLNQLKDESDKVSVISTFQDELKLKLLDLLTDDYYKIKVILTFHSDQLKLEGIKKLQEDRSKEKVIETLTDLACIKQALNMIENDWKKALIIKQLPNEKDRLNLVSTLRHDYNRFEVIKTLTSDTLKVSSLCLIADTVYRVVIIHSISNHAMKVATIKSLPDELTKCEIIQFIEDETLKIQLLSTLKSRVNKLIILSQIQSDEIRTKEVTKIQNYQEEMKKIFQTGFYQILIHFNETLLLSIFDQKQMRILKEYQKIKNEKLRDFYRNYISTNYETVHMENLDQIVQILFQIELSNSSELRAFGDSIANRVLNHENPEQCLSSIENIFIKTNLPYVGKVFEVFKLLHPEPKDYQNNSPLLKRFENRPHSLQMMDLIIFNDLLKCAFGSNNRSLKTYLSTIEHGNQILAKVMHEKELLNRLNDPERKDLIQYLNQIELLFDCYQNWKKEKMNFKGEDELQLKLDKMIDRLNAEGKDYQEIPNRLIQKLCGISGINSLEAAQKYLDDQKIEADQKNRAASKGSFLLEEGDFVKGINKIDYLSNILQNGSVAKEFLGAFSDSDATPLDTDLSRILSKDLDGKKANELGKIIDSTESNLYGPIWLVLKNDPNRIKITRDSNSIETNDKSDSEFSKLEAFQTLGEGLYGIRTGFPSSEISYIVSECDFDKIGFEIARNDFYIPVVDQNGNLVFTPSDYDFLRSKMAGLSYYGEDIYTFSEHLINEETLLIASQLEQNNRETKSKNDLIVKKIKEVLIEQNFTMKNKIDGDLSEGVVEFLNTGSTGRGTNEPHDFDFDFVMRLDKKIFFTPSKLKEIKSAILKKLGKEPMENQKESDNFRLKEVKLDEKTNLDIDITFLSKTDQVSYSTDSCLKERLNSIYQQSPEQYQNVIANIILAKQILKEGGVYKSYHSEHPQGGLGGVGIENWILQNGGSFWDATQSFLNAASGKDFDAFKKNYSIWDFGKNHMAEIRGQYPYDNFITTNMNQSGYDKMVQVLTEWVKKQEYQQTSSFKK